MSTAHARADGPIDAPSAAGYYHTASSGVDYGARHRLCGLLPSTTSDGGEEVGPAVARPSAMGDRAPAAALVTSTVESRNPCG